MRKRKPKVYVGIVTYNSLPLMAQCLDGLFRQTYSPLVIIVLDNSSKDDICTFMRQYPSVSFIQSKNNIGFGNGHNEIIRLSHIRKQDYYLALNPDVELDVTYVARLVSALQRGEADWGVGKLYKNRQRTLFYSVGHALFRDGYAFNIGYEQKEEHQYDSGKEIFGAPGAAALYSGRLINALSKDNNFFDPNIFMYYEDVDVDWRANRAGFHCWYEPKAIAFHPGGSFPNHLEAEVLSNRFYTTIKNANIVDLFTYNLPVIVLHVCARIILTPAVGMTIVRLLAQRVRRGTLQRVGTDKTRAAMHMWFRRAAKELSGQPNTVLLRLRSFARRRR